MFHSCCMDHVLLIVIPWLLAMSTVRQHVLLIPYILSGVAVDGDIIIVESLNNYITINKRNEKTEIQFGKGMSNCGVSITLTSFSSVVAFTINSFFTFAPLCFIANYISQLIIFVPFLILDQRRIDPKRNKYHNFKYHNCNSLNKRYRQVYSTQKY